ncbi:hypothetical protein [Desulfosarcina ovata]|nr:hypothetical protein [Desulfosarcina ovata]
MKDVTELTFFRLNKKNQNLEHSKPNAPLAPMLRVGAAMDFR